MGEEYRGRLPLATAGDLPNPVISIPSDYLVSPALADEFFPPTAPWEAPKVHQRIYKEKKKTKNTISPCGIFMRPS